MSWQQNLYDELARDPERWLKLGDLFEKFRLELLLHFVMRHANRKYKDGVTPNPERAERLYFLHTLRMIGVDRQGTSRSWVYSDTVRIRQVPGHSC